MVAAIAVSMFVLAGCESGDAEPASAVESVATRSDAPPIPPNAPAADTPTPVPNVPTSALRTIAPTPTSTPSVAPSPTPAFTSIQAAVDAATDGDVIVIPPGTYQENVVIGSQSITLRSSVPDDPDIVAATVIDGGGAGSVISFAGRAAAEAAGASNVRRANAAIARHFLALSFTSADDGTPSIAVLRAIGPTSSHGEAPRLTVEGLSIRNGSSEFGGGISVRSGALTVRNSVVSGNRSDGDGGGIGGLDAFGSWLIENVLIEGNDAAGNGGGIFLEDVSDLFVFRGSTVSGNQAGGNGGGLAGIRLSGGLEIEGVEIDANGAVGDGGGLYVSHSMGATINGATLSGNTADGSGGGVAWVDSYGLTFSDGTIEGNSAGVDGGGAFSHSFDTPLPDGALWFSFQETTFLRNTAIGDGGGFDLTVSGAELINVTFIDNSSGGNGGGAAVASTSSTLAAGASWTVGSSSAFIGNFAEVNGGGCTSRPTRSHRRSLTPR